MRGGKGGFVNCESRGCDGGTTVSLLNHIRDKLLKPYRNAASRSCQSRAPGYPASWPIFLLSGVT